MEARNVRDQAHVFTAPLSHLYGLSRLAASSVPWKEARREIGDLMLGDIQDNFDRQTLYTGEAMPQSKAARGRQGKTLIDKHHLYDSYLDAGAQDTDTGIVLGSNSVYARIHHSGGETGRPGHRFHMTARPVLGVGPKQERRIGDALIREIEALPA